MHSISRVAREPAVSSRRILISVCLQCSTARHSHRLIASMTKTVVSCNLTQYSLGARCAPRNRPAAVVQKGDGCRWVFIGTRLSHQTFSLTSLSHKSFSSAKSFSVCGGVLGSLHSGKHSKQVAALQPHASNEASATSFSLVFLTVLARSSFSRVFLISLPLSLPAHEQAPTVTCHGDLDRCHISRT